MNHSSQTSQIAISVKNVYKQFTIPHEKTDTLKGAFINLFRKNTYEKFFALKDVSFEVKKGEFFGILGRNGSGKSTLLKILAGVYTANKGSVHINGLISPFLELGIGFNPELSGRDNIYLNATVLGLCEKEIDAKFDSIVAFSELDRFIDQKVKNYSSGMQVRLAFSVAIHANREILLMDEVLAVGDSNFQSKCLREFARYKEMGKTVILVTHDIGTVQRYCDRAMLLRNGEVVKIGSAEEVGNEYIYQNMSDEEKRIKKEQEDARAKTNKDMVQAEKDAEKMKGKALDEEKNKLEEERRRQAEEQKKQEEERKNKVAEITNVEFLDKDGKVKNVFETGEDIVARIHYLARQKVEKPVFGVAIYKEEGIHVSGPNTKDSGFIIDSIEGKGHIDFYMCSNRFFTGRILFTAAIYNWECITPFDFKDKAYSFGIISKEKNQNGSVKLDISWKK
jgi:ABC-type polysaccharide/polyol phosphate transport system ATPase subunit